jgi:mevalonate kinase
MEKEFYSNGKLLLSGEYAILDGAKGWAVPTKFGQYLKVSEAKSKFLTWKSLDEKGSVWFEASYELESMDELFASDAEISKRLCKILTEARALNATFLRDASGYHVETKLTFPRDWGLGTSSTLINNIAQLAQVNAHRLLAKTFGGSGYDIACAQYPKSILYQINDGIPSVLEHDYSSNFTQSLFFIYLNRKQNSDDAIKTYRALSVDRKELVSRISQITQQMVLSKTIDDFEFLMTCHEKELSKTLGTPTIKSKLFPDYQGAIKSLGAWGGDFILATGNEISMDYFKQKGYKTILPFSEMVL